VRWSVVGAVVLLLLGAFAFWVRHQRPQGGLPPPWGRLEAALEARDLAALRDLAGTQSYAAVVAARALAEDPRVPREERLRRVATVVAFEGPKAALWGGRLLERLGEPDRAVALYRQVIGRPEARKALDRLAGEGNPAAEAALLAAGRYHDALRYARRPGDRGRALLGLGRYREALGLLKSPVDRARALLALGYHREAEAAFRQAGDRLGVAQALWAQGRRKAALLAFLSAGDRGLWEAAGRIEAEDPRQAVALYLRLARSDTELGAEAAYRAYQLGRRLGEWGLADRAYRLLRGGYAALSGKPLGRLVIEPLPETSPEGLDTVWALARAGRWAWAKGEARVRAGRASGDDRRAWAWVLYLLGDYRNAARYGGARLRYPTPWRKAVFSAARQNGLDPWLLFAVIRVESAFDPGAVSPTGARGLLQFTDGTWRAVAGRFGEPPANPEDPQSAIRYGAYYLGRLKRRFGDVRLALTAYNGGPGYVARGLRKYRNFEDFWRFQPREEPRRYLGRVARDWAIYRALASAPRRAPVFLAGFPSPP